jgi:hypothetical protein
MEIAVGSYIEGSFSGDFILSRRVSARFAGEFGLYKTFLPRIRRSFGGKESKRGSSGAIAYNSVSPAHFSSFSIFSSLSIKELRLDPTKIS